MSTLSGSFKKDPGETLRYVMDFTAQLSAGEIVSSLSYVITSPSGDAPSNLTVSTIAIASNGLQASFYVAGGTNGQNYEIAFTTITSIAQHLIDVVAITVQSKV